jgi:hypothetical protein
VKITRSLPQKIFLCKHPFLQSSRALAHLSFLKKCLKLFIISNVIAYGIWRFNAKFTWAPLMIPILNQISTICYIHTYFFKIHSNVVLQLMTCLPRGLTPVGLPVKISKAFLPTYPTHFNLPDYIT